MRNMQNLIFFFDDVALCMRVNLFLQLLKYIDWIGYMISDGTIDIHTRPQLKNNTIYCDLNLFQL